MIRSRQAGGLDVRRVGGAGPLPPHPHHRRQLRGLPQEPAEDDQGGEGQEEAEGRQDLRVRESAAVLQQQDDVLSQRSQSRLDLTTDCPFTWNCDLEFLLYLQI